jgi:LDH2 family malate/lactate/ureidoglycolate dehydrogenase
MTTKKTTKALGALDALKIKVNQDKDNDELSGHGTITDDTHKTLDPEYNQHKTTKQTATLKGEKTKRKTSHTRPGRPRIAANKKRVQITLTLDPKTYEKLQEWASTQPKSAPKLISDYLDYHIDDFLKKYNKI